MKRNETACTVNCRPERNASRRSLCGFLGSLYAVKDNLKILNESSVQKFIIIKSFHQHVSFIMVLYVYSQHLSIDQRQKCYYNIKYSTTVGYCKSINLFKYL